MCGRDLGHTCHPQNTHSYQALAYLKVKIFIILQIFVAKCLMLMPPVLQLNEANIDIVMWRAVLLGLLRIIPNISIIESEAGEWTHLKWC